MKNARLACRAGGFTIVEMLIAVVLLAAIVVLLATMLGSVNQAWVTAEQRVENFQSGRAILEMVARDLSQAVMTSQYQFVHNPGDSTKPSAPLNGLLSGTTSLKQAVNSDSIFWQMTCPNIYQGQVSPLGSIAEVGYYLTTGSSGNFPIYQLQRFFVPANSGTSVNSGTVPNPDYYFYNNTAFPSAMNNYPTAPQWIYAASKISPSISALQANSTPVSDGVIGFWVRCIDIDGNPIPWLNQAAGYSSASPMKYNSAASFQVAQLVSGTSFQYSDPATTAQANRLPAAVEISIATIDSRTLSLLSSNALTLPPLPQSTNATSIPGDIQTFMSLLVANKIKSAHLFSTTINLNTSGDPVTAK